MVINLDSEKGLNRKANPKKVKKPFVKKPYVKRNEDGSTPTTSDSQPKPYSKKPRPNTSEEM